MRFERRRPRDGLFNRHGYRVFGRAGDRRVADVNHLWGARVDGARLDWLRSRPTVSRTDSGHPNYVKGTTKEHAKQIAETSRARARHRRLGCGGLCAVWKQQVIGTAPRVKRAEARRRPRGRRWRRGHVRLHAPTCRRPARDLTGVMAAVPLLVKTPPAAHWLRIAAETDPRLARRCAGTTNTGSRDAGRDPDWDLKIIVQGQKARSLMRRQASPKGSPSMEHVD